MIKEIKNFKRKKLFEHYHSFDNPFIIITIKIDVTKVVEYCKKHKNFYATLGFLITKTVNEIEEFKYRYKDGKIYYCDEIISNYTEMYKDNTIGYFDVPIVPKDNNFAEYIENYIKIKNKFLEDNTYSPENNLSEIWLSCSPWFKFESLVPVFNKEITIPQFIWDKYENTNGKYYVDLMVMVHHGFADGSHIGKFIELLSQNINKFN